MGEYCIQNLPKFEVRKLMFADTAHAGSPWQKNSWLYPSPLHWLGQPESLRPLHNLLKQASGVNYVGTVNFIVFVQQLFHKEGGLCHHLLKSGHEVQLAKRRRLFGFALIHKCLLGRAQYLCSKFATNKSLDHHTIRGSSNLYLKRPTTNFYHNSFEYQGAFDWNHLPNNIKTRLFAQKLSLKVMHIIFFFFFFFLVSF